MKNFALIGQRLDYSFSKKFFTKKFEHENIDASYRNIELDSLATLKQIVVQENISGLNITIPFKQQIIAMLDEMTTIAQQANAVNCVKILEDGKWIGHNTDVTGFENSLLNILKTARPSALIFGSGGAALAVENVLKKLGMPYFMVSRTKKNSQLTYEDVDADLIKNHLLLINTSPLGTFPNIKESIEIPYQAITAQHFCFDVIYNPSETEFLKRSREQGAQIKNGQEMLEIQAEESYAFWTKQ